MATEVLMPALSPTMEEGTLAKWLVKEGDTVTSGQIIADSETDKATMEVEAAHAGFLAALLADEGDDVPVGQVIAASVTGVGGPAIDLVNAWVAKTVAWVVVVIIATTIYEIVMRYVFNAPTDWVFEFNYLIHGPYFLLLGAYTFAINGHVNVDILYARLSPRTRAVVARAAPAAPSSTTPTTIRMICPCAPIMNIRPNKATTAAIKMLIMNYIVV